MSKSACFCHKSSHIWKRKKDPDMYSDGCNIWAVQQHSRRNNFLLANIQPNQSKSNRRYSGFLFSCTTLWPNTHGIMGLNSKFIWYVVVLCASSQQICMMPSCSHVPYHQQDICCKRVCSSCSNQCASFSTSLWATSIRRRKNVVSYLFMTSFLILHSPPMRPCMHSPLYSHPKRQINVEQFSCYSI